MPVNDTDIVSTFGPLNLLANGDIQIAAGKTLRLLNSTGGLLLEASSGYLSAPTGLRAQAAVTATSFENDGAAPTVVKNSLGFPVSIESPQTNVSDALATPLNPTL